MAKTYEQYSLESTSEKITLCHIEPSSRFLLWTLDSGAIYTRTEATRVISIKQDDTALTEAANASLSSGEWFYDDITATLYIRTTDDSNPNTKTVVGTYRYCFASTPLDLPYDLASGNDTHYEGVYSSNSMITKELDDEQTGVALESNTTVALQNTSGLFDNIYDTIFFENKKIKIYSWSLSIPLSEKKLLFDGIIQDKSFTNKKITFKCKDFMYKLREPVPLSLFTSADGSISETYIDTPKRRIYGQVNKARCIPIDNALEGYALTGTLSGVVTETTIIGVGTAFLDECSPGDTIIIELLNESLELSIESVESDTGLTLSDEIGVSFSGETVKISTERPWRKKNRRWHVAGHKLRAPSTTIASASQPNRFSITDPTDFFADDLISVNGENAFIKRISGSNIVLKSNLQGGTPTIGQAVLKSPASKVFIGNKEVFTGRDWSISNTTEAILTLENDAELNVANSLKLEGSVTFTNGSREVTATGVSFSALMESRDFIRSGDISHTNYYEILSVQEESLTLRTPYAGSTLVSTSTRYKNPEFLRDDSYVTINCLGMEHDGAWVQNASNVVQNLVNVDAGLTIDSTSFNFAAISAPYTISMVLPEAPGRRSPIIRDVITKINESVFGSLVNDTNWNLVYNVLDTERPTDLTPIEDDDIIGDFSVKSSNKIVRQINASYSPFVDIFTNEDTFKVINYENTFVDSYIGTLEEKDVTLYLFNESDAQEITERYALYNSLTQSVVSIKTKLNLALKNLNDKLYLKFDRLYKRFAGGDNLKIGIITKIQKSGEGTAVEMADLSNVFNRVFSVADDSSADFTSAENSEKIINSYIVDDDLHIPDTSDETQFGSNLIG